MAVWEYAELVAVAGNDMVFYSASAPHGENQRGGTHQILTKIGSDEWELVAVTLDSVSDPPAMVYTFKRQA